jgi:hypothetical protein
MDIPVIVMLNKSRVTELLQGPTTGLLIPVPVTMATVLLTLRVPAVIQRLVELTQHLTDQLMVQLLQLLRVLSTTLLTDLDLMEPHLDLMEPHLVLMEPHLVLMEPHLVLMEPHLVLMEPHLDLMEPHLVLMVQDLMLVRLMATWILLMALIRPPLITEGHHHMDHLIQDRLTVATATWDLLTALMASLNLPTILMVIWPALLTETLMLVTVQITGATLDTTELEVTVLM